MARTAKLTDDAQLDRIFNRCESLDETPEPFRNVATKRQAIPIVPIVADAGVLQPPLPVSPPPVRDAIGEVFAATRTDVAFASAERALSITRCPVCRMPTHASESDDEGRCVRCMPIPVSPAWRPSDGGEHETLAEREQMLQDDALEPDEDELRYQQYGSDPDEHDPRAHGVASGAW